MRVVQDRQPGITFVDVSGVDEPRQELQEIVEFFKEPQRFAALGERIPRGVPFFGKAKRSTPWIAFVDEITGVSRAALDHRMAHNARQLRRVKWLVVPSCEPRRKMGQTSG